MPSDDLNVTRRPILYNVSQNMFNSFVWALSCWPGALFIVPMMQGNSVYRFTD